MLGKKYRVQRVSVGLSDPSVYSMRLSLYSIRRDYHYLQQSREISGSNDPEDTEKSSKQNSTEFVCTQRLANLPIVASINSSITGAYTSVKQSHPTVEKIFGTTEEGFSEGAQMVAPVISKIESTLKEPLKCIDAVICDGLDYLENNVPSVKLPPAEMYDNIEEYVRYFSAFIYFGIGVNRYSLLVLQRSGHVYKLLAVLLCIVYSVSCLEQRAVCDFCIFIHCMYKQKSVQIFWNLLLPVIFFLEFFGFDAVFLYSSVLPFLRN